jgi:transcriptional regulator with XRE-family HTH domain
MLTQNDLLNIVFARTWLKSGDARKAREEAGISLRTMAKLAGAAPISLSRWERGLASPRDAAALTYVPILMAVLDALEDALEDQPDSTSDSLEQRELLNAIEDDPY